MMGQDTGGRAFDPNNGMYLRDYFAAQALKGLLSDSRTIGECSSRADDIGRDVSAVVARSAYEIADAMLAAREA